MSPGEMLGSFIGKVIIAIFVVIILISAGPIGWAALAFLAFQAFL